MQGKVFPTIKINFHLYAYLKDITCKHRGLYTRKRTKEVLYGQIDSNAELNKILEDIIELVAYRRVTPQEAAKRLVQEYGSKLDELRSR